METFKVHETATADGVALRWIELPDGTHRIEEWHPGKRCWVPDNAYAPDWDKIWSSPSITPAFAAGLGIPLSDITTAPRRFLPTEYERELSAGKAILEALREVNEEDRDHAIPDDLSIPEFLKRTPTTTRPRNPPRLPTPAEQDDMLSRDLADGLREWNEKHGRSNTQSLTAKQLREAIRLGVKLAEEEALFKLTIAAAAPGVGPGSNRATTGVIVKFRPQLGRPAQPTP